MTSLDKLNNNNKMCYICDIYYIKIFCSSSSVFTNRPGFFPAFFSPRSETVSSMRIRIPEALFKCVFGARERKKNVLLIIARKVTSTISQLWAVFLPVMIGQTNNFSSIRVGWGYRERYNSTTYVTYVRNYFPRGLYLNASKSLHRPTAFNETQKKIFAYLNLIRVALSRGKIQRRPRLQLRLRLHIQLWENFY